MGYGVWSDNGFWATSEFWNTMAGVVVGGLIAFGIQCVVMRRDTIQREVEKTERRKVHSFGFFIKMMKIHTNFDNFRDLIGEPSEKEPQTGDIVRPCLTIKVPGNLPDKIEFAPDEMALLLSSNNIDFFNKIAPMDAIHNSTIELFQTFTKQRRELETMLPDPETMDGVIGSMALTSDQVRSLEPKMAAIDDLIAIMRKRCKSDADESYDLLLDLIKLLNQEFGLSLKVEKIPEAEAAT